MYTQHFNKALLLTLLVNIPLTIKADVPDCIKNNVVHILLGLGGTGAAVAAYYFGQSKAKEKYTFEENEGQRKHELAMAQLNEAREAAELQRQRDEQLAQEKLAERERLILERVQDFLAACTKNTEDSFDNLYSTFSSISYESLQHNEEFQRRLNILVRGANAHANYLFTFNRTIDYEIADLSSLKNPAYDKIKKELKNKLFWAKIAANNSRIIEYEQLEAIKRNSAVEFEQNKARVAAEQLVQQQLQTETTREICSGNKEIIELNRETTRALNKTAHEMTGQLDRASTNLTAQVNGALDEIHGLMAILVANNQDAHEGLKKSDAERSEEFHKMLEKYASILVLLPKLELGLDATRAFLTECLTQLTGLEAKQVESSTNILNKLASIDTMPDDIRFSLEEHIKKEHASTKKSIDELKGKIDTLSQHVLYDAQKPSAPTSNLFQGYSSSKVSPEFETP